MLEDATVLDVMKYAPFHFKSVRHHFEMQVIRQTRKATHCSVESYLASFCDTVQKQRIRKERDKCRQTMDNYVTSLYAAVLHNGFLLYAKKSLIIKR